jgi:hypothetical protein
MVFEEDIRCRIRVEINENFIAECVREWLDSRDEEMTPIYDEESITEITRKVEYKLWCQLNKGATVNMQEIVHDMIGLFFGLSS